MMDGMFGLKPQVLEKLQIVFKTFPEIEKVILYGSRAIGNYKQASDIDLSIVGMDLDLPLQFAIENQLDDLLLPYKIDISIFHKIDNEKLLQHIEQFGKVIYNKVGQYDSL